MAIDQATTSGWAFFEDGKLIKYGLLINKNNQYPLEMFFREIMLLKMELNPDLIIWENLKSNRNADTIRRLGEITGILRLICEREDIRYCEFVPVSVRAKLCNIKTGKRGRATKIDLAREMCMKFNLEFPKKKNGEEVSNESHNFFNITDSIGLGDYYFRYGEMNSGTNKRIKKQIKDK